MQDLLVGYLFWKLAVRCAKVSGRAVVYLICSIANADETFVISIREMSFLVEFIVGSDIWYNNTQQVVYLAHSCDKNSTISGKICDGMMELFQPLYTMRISSN